MGTLLVLEATGILTQDAEPGGTTLVDACNGFNNLSRLTILWTLYHHWPAGARFAINCYRHWAQLLLNRPGDVPFVLLIREGVTQGYPLSVVLYRIALVPLTEELRDGDTTISPPFYANDVVFDGLEMQSAAQLRLLINWGMEKGYLPETANSLFIANSLE